MNSSLRSLLLITAGCLSGHLFAADKVYTPPAIPAGMSRTCFPTPRNDWAKAVQKDFDNAGGKQYDLVFDGDSLTAGWNWKDRGDAIWAARYAKLNAVDFGIAGDQTQNVLWRLRHGELDGVNPKLIVLMIGSNNLTIGNFSPEDTAVGVKALIDEYSKDAPDAKLLLLAVLPKSLHATDPIRAKITQLNTLIAAMADDKRITYLDFTDKFKEPDGTLEKDLYVADMTHPSAKGYQVWADAIEPEIEKSFPAAASTTPAPAPAP
jgi:lysophospholipase L1-like esterase